MRDVLAEILEHKRVEVERARAAAAIAQFQAVPAYAAPPREFAAALISHHDGPHLIAEIKQRSPSAGVRRNKS